MLNKLTAQCNNQNRRFKPKIYKGKRRGKTRYYYDQGMLIPIEMTLVEKILEQH